MKDRYDVLDNGYVQLVETWGSDARIIEAARMSTAKGFLGWGPLKCDKCDGTGQGSPPARVEGHYLTFSCAKCKGEGTVPGDEKLLRFLWEHKHLTPFEMAGMAVEVQAPIFVFREWHRHRTQSYNEMSARYTALPDLYYVPSRERMMAGAQAATNKQSSAAGFGDAEAEFLREKIEEVYALQRQAYEIFLKQGVARELARIILPVGQYSRMRASANLRNWLAFLTLRMDAGAQWEIRQYAMAVASLLNDCFPRTYALFAVPA